jgi:hypothetical protein
VQAPEVSARVDRVAEVSEIPVWARDILKRGSGRESGVQLTVVAVWCGVGRRQPRVDLGAATVEVN